MDSSGISPFPDHYPDTTHSLTHSWVFTQTQMSQIKVQKHLRDDEEKRTTLALKFKVYIRAY